MNPGISKNQNSNILRALPINRGMAFGVLIITALFAFEIFNYSTTDFALTDLLGDLRFLGLRWATILAIAFCGIDFAGIARLFTLEGSSSSHNETWYLFGAWLLAATMNAMLTWWGVSLAILNHETLGNAVIERATLLRIVPIFVSILVWLIRVLIIGAFAAAGDRLFALGDPPARAQLRPASRPTLSPASRSLNARPAAPRSASLSANKATYRATRAASPPPPEHPEPPYTRPEPTYHPINAIAQRRTPVSEAEEIDKPTSRSATLTRKF